jgi:hypothetical protein
LTIFGIAHCLDELKAAAHDQTVAWTETREMNTVARFPRSFLPHQKSLGCE